MFIDIHIVLHEVLTAVAADEWLGKCSEHVVLNCIASRTLLSHFILVYRQIRSKFSRMSFCVSCLPIRRTCSLYLYILSFVLFLVYVRLPLCILIIIRVYGVVLHSTSGCYMQTRCINTFRDALRT